MGLANSDPNSAALVVAGSFVEGCLDVLALSNAKIASDKKSCVSKQY